MTTLHHTSLDIIRAGQSPNGAYAACASFSQYGYSWLRDGAWIAYGMDKAGQPDSAAAFHRWAARTLAQYQPQVDALLAKIERGEQPQESDYLPTRFELDGQLGTEDWPDFQLDGYGAWLWGLCQHNDAAVWDEARPAVAMLVQYLAALWQSPNYDCWEEHRQQIHTATLAALYGGLNAVRQLDPTLVPAGLPEQIRDFVLTNCVSPHGHFVKFIGNDAVDSSLLWVALPYGLVDIHDPRFQATLAKIETDIHRPGGGVYRYAADTYYGGGEWLLLTAWLAWVYVELHRIDEAKQLFTWIKQQATPNGELPEQVSDHVLDASYYPGWVERWGTSACPLLWSHGMYLILEARLMQIIHTPYGQEHPYEQLPEERFPRQPLAGEPFTGGIVTRPPGIVQNVVVHQKLDGQILPSVAAICQTDWQAKQEEGVGAEFLDRIVRVEQDVWHAHLTAPAFGQTLTYWLEADGVRSADYTLRGESWQSGGGWSRDGQTMHVSRTGSTDSAPRSPIDVSWLNAGDRARRVRLTFTCQPDEAFFGLGERFNALNQRGNMLDVRCYEQYKNQGQRTYMPIPFLLSSAGYGVYVESSRWMQFDLAATDSNTWTLEADLGADETLNLIWFEAANPLQIIGQFTRYTGPAVLPPVWAFGLWMSGNEWNSQARIEKEVRASLEHGIAPSVLVIEAWSDETTFYIWNDAQYLPRPGHDAPHYSDFTFPPDGKWTDPKGMVDWLHDHEVKVLLWQIPVMKILERPHAQHEADRAWFEQQKLGVREADGSLHQVRPFWFRGGYIWDVTNPAARDWWLNKRAYLLDEVGIDGFKTDGGEHLWGADTRFADGRSGDELWNEYPRHYSEAYFQFATAKREAITFSRAGFTGSQRSPLHWAGDENSTWDAFRHSILAGLSAGISGIPFWGWDLGGFSGDLPSAELYLRGTAMAAFCPVMQYHSEFNQHREPNRDRTPWNMQARTGDDRLIDTFRFFVNVRRNLLPYIWQEAQHSATTGEPMMRALRLTDPHASDYQYFFGRDLLICPVVEPDTQRWSVYLPAGEWYSLWDKTAYTGGVTIDIDAPLNRLPVFVRANTQIPVCQPHWGEPVDLSTTATHWLKFE